MEAKKKHLLTIKFKEFNECEVLLDFTNVDEKGEYSVSWNKSEFDKAEVKLSDDEIRNIVESYIEQSLLEASKSNEKE